jgi:hemerythrin
VPILEWQDNFKVGVEQFDCHHEHLIELLNATYDNFVVDYHVSKHGKILDALVDYSTYHFSAEERWMKENNYPKFAEHLNYHG